MRRSGLGIRTSCLPMSIRIWAIGDHCRWGGSGVSLLLYVEDVDSLLRQAVEAGAMEKKPLTDEFYGDRTGTVVDPHGHVWSIATHREGISPEEMARRFEELIKKSSSQS